MRGYLIPREGCVVVGVAKVSLVEVQLVVHEGLEVLKVSLGEILLEEPKIRVISRNCFYYQFHNMTLYICLRGHPCSLRWPVGTVDFVKFAATHRPSAVQISLR